VEKKARTWVLTRADLSAGGGVLLRLWHPLLPEFTRALPGPSGLVLGPAVPAPAPLEAELSAAARAAYLARFVGLCAFLRHHGLGLAPRDLALCGSRRGEPARPALASPPVPAWQAASPALAGAVLAARLGGATVAGEDTGALAAAVDAVLEDGLAGAAADEVRTARRADEGGLSAEALVAELAVRAGDEALGPDLLGLAYPSAFRGGDGEAGPAASAWGEAALFVARGAARRAHEPAFVEIASSSPLQEGSALANLASALGGDPRAAALRVLAAGGDPGPAPDGPPLALVAVGAHLWDPRSKRALEARLPALGFRSFETRPRPAPVWESRTPLEPALGVGEVSALLWLPFVSLTNAVAAWEAVVSAAGADPARLVEAARRLAADFDPRDRRAKFTADSLRHVPVLRPARDPVLAAASLLPDVFTAAEAAAGAGIPEREALAALDAACASGQLLAQGPDFRFADPAMRDRAAAGLPKAARSDAVRRLEASGAGESRLAPGLLARGRAEDLQRVRAALNAAGERGDREGVLEILGRAEALQRDLAVPLLAFRAFLGAGRLGEAREAARRLREDDLLAVRGPERLAVARHLVRLGENARALALFEGAATPLELLGRAQVLLDAHREGEAARLLSRADLTPEALPPPVRLRTVLLLADLAWRRHEYEKAMSLLVTVGDLLPMADAEDLRLEAAMTAGFLASDMRRPDEAMAFFRQAQAMTRDDGQRADISLDLATDAIYSGRFDVAEKELETALALYARQGDEARYVMALGNRVDLLMKAGDYAAARPILERVVAYESAPGREFKYLFAVPSLQELALLEGEDARAQEAFREGEVRRRGLDGHVAWRDALVLEGARLLMAGRPREAEERLGEAGRIPENRGNGEPLRQRLLASAAIDQGRSAAPPSGLDPGEALLLSAEVALAGGGEPPESALLHLQRRAGTGSGSAAVVWRVLEWAGRFPSFFSGSRAGGLVRLGARAAARAGLPRAGLRFDLLSRRIAPETLARSAPAAGGRRPQIVAEDPSTKAVFSLVAKIAPTSRPLLVLGESGTGKEVVALELHRLSGRSGPFVPVNVAALSSTLIESELFGHAKGAFTGADRDRPGLIEAASGGTLLLDEIGDLPLALQAKLLRVLQEGEVMRVGETRTRRVDLRVVAATHRDLPAMVEAGTYRRDLYYRLAGVEATLAPLRERPLDLARLVDRTLDGAATLSAEARRLVEGFPWPGNVRELVSALEAARVLAAPARVIEPGHLPLAVRSSGAPSAPETPTTYRDAVDDAKRKVIGSALRTSRGNRTRAAALLGLSRQSLHSEMKRLKVDA
jgi:DNA-binding NtrC family response regulator/tetratricopeptide (TPR) repeat protein